MNLITLYTNDETNRQKDFVVNDYTLRNLENMSDLGGFTRFTLDHVNDTEEPEDETDTGKIANWLDKFIFKDNLQKSIKTQLDYRTRAEKLTEGLDFEDHQETVNYLFLSELNGQMQQVKIHFAHLLSAFEADELRGYLAGSVDAWGLKKVIDVLTYCGYSRTNIENIFHDHRKHEFSDAVEYLNEKEY